ncbi:MAG: universal stress protein [Rhizobiaceae bacterium]
MSYKTILVCLTNKSTADSLCVLACNVARQFNAHLIGLHTLPSISVYPGISVPLSSEFEASFRDQQLAEAHEIEDVFRSHTEIEDFISEWRCVEAQSPSVGDMMVEHARCADLIIISQSDDEHDSPNLYTMQRNVLENSGRPILVVPAFGKFETIGKKVLVGWSATREASRAVHDAIPILQKSESTHIFWVSKTASDKSYLAQSAHELATGLDRHGITVEISHRIEQGIPIGDELLNEAADSGADLIVSGAYGHSRVYDFLVGATTPYLMKHMTVPVLFSC